MPEIIPLECIENKIYLLRSKKVMLDRDLAKMYGVATKTFNQAIKRNHQRFPADFMFRLNLKEFSNLRSQIVTSSWGGQRYLPYAFTENGVAMLSSILNSERAIQVNIQIMRVFTKLREMMATHRELREKIEALEQKYDHQFTVVFEAIKELLQPPVKASPRIGFMAHSRKK
jgi:phage regulator Rha-like protein